MARKKNITEVESMELESMELESMELESMELESTELESTELESTELESSVADRWENVSCETSLTEISGDIPLTRFEDVNTSVRKILSAIVAGRRTDKEIARQFHEIVSNENRDLAFIELGAYTLTDSGKKALTFPKAIDRIFNGTYSGQTAYRYAKVYEDFGKLEEWRDLSIGKLSILTALKDKKVTLRERLDDFYKKVGVAICTPTLEKWKEWKEDNRALLETIDYLKESGAPEIMIETQWKNIPAEPEVIGYIPDDSGEWVEDDSTLISEGYALVKSKPDSWLKEALKVCQPEKKKKEASKKDLAKKALKALKEYAEKAFTSNDMPFWCESSLEKLEQIANN